MEYLNDMFSAFSEAFVGTMEGEGDIPFRHQLNTTVLDFSLESLLAVDDYLIYVFKHTTELSDLEYQNLVVWGGAYIGEVLRKHAPSTYNWMEYESYMNTQNESLRNLIPLGLTTHALLVKSHDLYMTMPMNKIARYLEEGEEHNTSYYVTVDINKR